MAPCRTYHRERSVFGRPEAGASCSAELRCDASDLGVRRLRQLLRHPDVQRALASGHDGALFGCDLRPVDVPIFVIEADGGSFGVGADCSECAGPRECESPPAGVGDLVRFLRDLDDRMEQREPCRSALEPR